MDNNDNIIDSRDVIARIEEVEKFTAYHEEYPAGDHGDYADCALCEDEVATELASLKDLADQGENSADDWEYGATLVRDSYFQTYAEELADDLGAVPSDVSWPLTCIDWEQAARELQMDYSAVTFDGVTYWVR